MRNIRGGLGERNSFRFLINELAKYYPEVAEMSFEDQLNYLIESMPQEFKIFGRLYKEGFTYTDFLALTDPAEAAQAFAVVYERCNSASYNKRQVAATKAYEYFNLNS